jgi:hypothetical protein
MKLREKILIYAALLFGLGALSLWGVQVLGYQDLQVISTPGNPASGFVRFFGASGGLNCLTSSGGNCLTATSIGGASVPSNCAIVNTNGSQQLQCQTAKGLASVAYAAGGGTANAQTVTYSPAVAALADIVGYPICWLPTANNTTTTPTLNVNGLGAATIVKAGGAVAASDIITTAVACAIWDGTKYELQNPQTASGSTSPLTTKGDIFVYSSTNTRLPVGSDGTCLTAQSAQTTGLLWTSCTAGGGGALTQIGQTVANGMSGTISFTSIPGSYSGLQLDCFGRVSDTATGENITLEFNSDTGANYIRQYIQGANNATSAAATTAAAPTTFGAFAFPAASATANYSAVGTLLIPGYAGTTFFKTLQAKYNLPTSNSAAAFFNVDQFISWLSTSAITRIDLIDSGGGNFVSGTTCTLYGKQ